MESFGAIADGVYYIGSGAGFYLSAVRSGTGKRAEIQSVAEGIASRGCGAEWRLYIGDLAGIFSRCRTHERESAVDLQARREITSASVALDDRVLLDLRRRGYFFGAKERAVCGKSLLRIMCTEPRPISEGSPTFPDWR